MKSKHNPVLRHVEGFAIKKVNQVTLSLSDTEYERLIKAHVDSGRVLSLPKILALQGKACTNCGQDQIDISLPRNILSARKANTGGTISNQQS